MAEAHSEEMRKFAASKDEPEAKQRRLCMLHDHRAEAAAQVKALEAELAESALNAELAVLEADRSFVSGQETAVAGGMVS